METGIDAFNEERQKQIDKHGFTGEHHAEHPEWYDLGQLTTASNILAHENLNGKLIQVPVNWDIEWFDRLCKKPFKQRLKISGALLAAEWDRQKALGNFD